MPPRRSPRPPSASTSWESVADWYTDYLGKPGTLQQTIVFPKTLKLLGPKSGGTYLDVACGEGAFSRLLAREPGVLIDGFDASPSLIEKAKTYAPRKTRYAVADARDLSKFVTKTYDGAVCILALQNIEPMEPVLAQVSRALKTDASFVIVLNHPCFREPRQSGWGWDENRKIQYRRVDRYLTPYEQPIEAHPGTRDGERTSSFHRPLSTYVNALSANGFSVDAMEEWVSAKTSDSGPRAKAENVARAEIPLFLALRAKKIP